MNITVTLTLVVLLILIAVFVFGGIYLKRMAVSSTDFLLAGRNVPFWLLVSGYFGGMIGGASVSGFVNLGFTQGVSAMWTGLFLMSGVMTFLLLFARRINYFGRKTGAVTMADFICARYGEVMRIPAAITSFIRPAVLTGMQFLAIAVVANIIFGISLEVGTVGAAVFIMLYLITAGQYSAMVTQWFQAVLQAVGMLFFAFTTYRVVGDPVTVVNAMYEVLDSTFVTFWTISPIFTVWFLTFFLYYICDPWLYMNAYLGKSPRISSNAMITVYGFSFYGFLPFLSGLTLVVGVVLNRIVIPAGMAGDGLYTWFALNFSSTAVGVVILVALLTTILSCGSSFVMSGVGVLTRDFYQKGINKNANEKQMLFASRVSLIVITGMGIAAALWVPILVPLWSLGQALGLSGLFCTIVAAWFWKRSTTAGAMASCIGGLGISFAWAAYAWINYGTPAAFVHVAGIPIHAAHVGIVTSLVLMIVVSLATPPEYEKTEATCWKTLGKEMETSELVTDKKTGTGIFGYFGADTPRLKAFWVFILVLLALSYLPLGLEIPFFGHALTWVSLVIGTLMAVVIAVKGWQDIRKMAAEGKANKESQS